MQQEIDRRATECPQPPNEPAAGHCPRRKPGLGAVRPADGCRRADMARRVLGEIHPDFGERIVTSVRQVLQLPRGAASQTAALLLAAGLCSTGPALATAARPTAMPADNVQIQSILTLDASTSGRRAAADRPKTPSSSSSADGANDSWVALTLGVAGALLLMARRRLPR